MPRPIRGIPPRRKDEMAYNRTLRRLILDPLMVDLRAGLSRAASASLALDEIDRVQWDRGQTQGLVNAEIDAQSLRIQGYHRDRLIQTFRTALGVDIRPLLAERDIALAMDIWRQENINLIRTIPPRFHEGLYQRVSQTFAQQPFDRQALAQMLSREYQSSGWNLRRLTRDQTNKAVGQLTKARHMQIGVESFRWSTSMDERVRPSHVDLEGKGVSV